MTSRMTRIRPKFHLAGMLAFTTAICLILAAAVHEASRQRQLVTYLRLQGADVIMIEKGILPSSIDFAYCDRVTHILFTSGVSPPERPDVVRVVIEFPNLSDLSLIGCQVEDVRPLARLEHLRELFLPTSQVSEDDLAWLKGELPNCSIYTMP